MTATDWRRRRPRRAADADAEVADLYLALAARVLRYLRARLPSDAEDVAAQVWLELAACKNLPPTFEERRALAFTVARRRAADARRNARRRPVSLLAPVDLDECHTADDTGRLDPARLVASVLSGEEATRLIVALLPAEQADIVLMRVVGGLSTSEVAEIVGRPPGTVRVLLHRALHRLAANLELDQRTFSTEV